jgi:hypothetical protein
VRTTESKAAAAARIGAVLARRRRAELLELLRPCFARTEPWLQAGKYAAAVMSQIPRRNGWTIAAHEGPAIEPDVSRSEGFAAREINGAVDCLRGWTDRRRATPVPERAEICGHERSPTGTGNIRPECVQVDLLHETAL